MLNLFKKSGVFAATAVLTAGCGLTGQYNNRPASQMPTYQGPQPYAQAQPYAQVQYGVQPYQAAQPSMSDGAMAELLQLRTQVENLQQALIGMRAEQQQMVKAMTALATRTEDAELQIAETQSYVSSVQELTEQVASAVGEANDSNAVVARFEQELAAESDRVSRMADELLAEIDGRVQGAVTAALSARFPSLRLAEASEQDAKAAQARKPVRVARNDPSEDSAASEPDDAHVRYAKVPPRLSQPTVQVVDPVKSAGAPAETRPTFSPEDFPLTAEEKALVPRFVTVNPDANLLGPEHRVLIASRGTDSEDQVVAATKSTEPTLTKASFSRTPAANDNTPEKPDGLGIGEKEVDWYRVVMRFSSKESADRVQMLAESRGYNDLLRVNTRRSQAIYFGAFKTERRAKRHAAAIKKSLLLEPTIRVDYKRG